MKSKPVRILLSAYFIGMSVKWFIEPNNHYPMQQFFVGVAAFIVILCIYYLFRTFQRYSQGFFNIKEEWSEILFWISMGTFWILRLIDTY